MRLILLTVLTMVAFAANSVLNRLAVGGGALDPQAFAVVRLASGALTLAVLLGFRHWLASGVVWPGWPGRLAGVAGLLSYLFGFSLAYQQLSAGTGALVLFGTVQITMFAGAVRAAEAIAPRRWVGAGLAFAGLCLLVATQVQQAGAYALAAMALAGFGWGVYSLAGRRAADALAATAWNFGLALPLALIIWGASGWTGLQSVTAPGVELAILSGAVTSGLGYALWYRVLPDLGAARAAVAQLTVPVIAAAGGLTLIGEGVTWRFVLSALIVLSGVGLASR